MSKISININGVEIITTEDKNILQAALDNHIQVPHLCYDERMEAYGGCGLCVVEIEGLPKLARACATPVKQGMVIKTHTKRTEATRKTALELLVSDHRGDCRPPCMMACPSHTDVQGYSGLIANGEYKEAVKLIKKDLPIPACIGRVCPHPCETDCRRNSVEKPVSIAALKTFAADYDLFDPREETYRATILPPTGKSVAIVGAGPAGLTAAYYLSEKGHGVTVYDAMDKPGGMMRYGIPQYRLPKHVIDAEVALIEDMGVQFKYQTKIGEDLTLPYLQKAYDAVFLAVGAWESSSMRCQGEEAEGVIGGIDFLRKVTQNEPLKLDDTVLVVGGGNTAMDVARTCVRLGVKEVRIVYRRTEDEMPAERIEIEEAKEEGVQFSFLSAPIRVIEEDGKAVGLLCQKMKLGEPDESGRRRPEAIEGQVETLHSTTIIAAIGQNVTLGNIHVQTTKWGTIQVNEGTFETNLPKVFAGGDAVTGPKIAIQAVADGKNASKVIHSYLEGQIIPHHEPIIVRQKDLTEDDFKQYQNEVRMPLIYLEPEIRKHSFQEVVTYYTEAMARKEGSRCLECGCKDYFECQLIHYVEKDKIDTDKNLGVNHKRYEPQTHPFVERNPDKCIQCGLCVRTCDEFMGITALGLVDRGFDAVIAPEFNQKLEETECISCGQCIDVCPVGALQEKIRTHKEIPLDLEKTEGICQMCSLGCHLNYQHNGDLVYKVTPNRDKDEGVLCQKGKFDFDIINLLDRIKVPTQKFNGKHIPIRQEEVVPLFASKLKSTKYAKGDNRIGFIVSQQLTNEDYEMIAKIAHSLGTQYLGSKDVKHQEVTSTIKFEELPNTELIITVGEVYESFAPMGVKIKNLGVPYISLSEKGTRLDQFTKQALQVDSLESLLESWLNAIENNNKNQEDMASEVLKPLITQYHGAKKVAFVVDENTVTEKAQRLIYNIAELTGQLNAVHGGLLMLKKQANAQGAINAGFVFPASDLIDKAKKGLINTLVVIGEEIDREGLEVLDYCIAMNAFSNETTKNAHMVLPLYLISESSGHLTRTDGKVQGTNQILPSKSDFNHSEFFKEVYFALNPNQS